MNIICAFPINLDAVYNIRGEHLASLAGGIVPEAKEKITSLEDLISALFFCVQEGSGAELLIEQEEVARSIESAFSWQYRLGGNAGIMANVLATLGGQPILNAPALSCRMAGMIHPAVRIPVAGSLREPMQATGDREMVHFVFQFVEGDAVDAPGGRIVARKDNRLIATFDPLNTQLYSNPDFDDFCRKRIQDFDGALVSGFHLAPTSGYEEIFQRKTRQIMSWKKINPGLYIHAEMGSFQKPEIMHRLLEMLPADSLGLNEDELAMIERLKPGWRGTMEAALSLRENLGLARVAIHTRDFILSIMKDLITPKDEVKALTHGADAAASLAATGSVTGPLPEEVNLSGLKARDEFCREGATPSGRGAFMLSKDVVMCLVPSLLARRPRFTVGLGDTATAATFYEEILAIKSLKPKD
jgi:ADP-dependent phosphofructokinase/glucokinase